MMKRILLISIIIILFSPNAFAANIDEYYEKGLEASGANELADKLSDETKDYLKKLGLEDIRFEIFLDVSPKELFLIIGDLLKDGLEKPLKGAMSAVGAVMLVSVCSGFFPNDEKGKSALNMISGCFVIISVFIPAWDSVKAAVGAMEACAVFEKALIPVLAAVVTLSGNPSLALSYKGASFAAAQIVESLAKDFAMPLIGVSGALGITGSVLPTLKLSAVSDLIRKTLITVLSASTALFTAFLGMKGVISASVDGMASKGVKLAASTFVPVIGGAIGDAYSSVIGSMNLIRSTVGIYGIAAILLTALPIMINLALWVAAMRFACMVSDLTDCRQCSEILKNIAFVFSMVNTLLLLCVIVFVITAGLVVLIKSGE